MIKNMANKINEISQAAISRYSARFKKLGFNVKALGWGSREQQKTRFAAASSGEVDFADKAVLDIGCGFGDYLGFLKNNNIAFKKYIGWDINPELISEAKRHLPKGVNNVSFKVKNIFDGRVNERNNADIVIMLGVINFNLKSKLNNYEYSKLCIKKAFDCAREVLIVDFLSNRMAQGYPKEDFVFYHDPCKMLEFALALSGDIVLKHNYAPIPQKEFMLFIFKKGRRK